MSPKLLLYHFSFLMLRWSNYVCLHVCIGELY